MLVLIHTQWSKGDDELIYNLILGVDVGKKEINNYSFI